MKEFVEKLIGRFEEEKEFYRKIRKNTHCRRTEMDDCDSCRADHYLNARLNCVDNLISIVNKLAEEYKPQLNDNDLMIVESLPSLYPMKEFEEEALQRVIGCAKKEYNNGWIPCEKKLPETNESVLCWAKSTARGGDVCFVGSYHKGFWFLQSSANTHSFPGQYKIVAWQKLPEPFKPSAE